MKTHTQQTQTVQSEIRKNLQEVSKNLKEISASQKETDQITKELKKELKELAREIKETDKQLRKTDALFNTKWSKLVESLVEGKLVELLQSRGIDVKETYSRVQRSYTDENGELQRREIDILAANGEEVVAVEVKTTLKPEDVKYFMETLKIFKRYFSIYANKTVYGAVAYLRSDSQAPLFAERQGLFVIRATGDSASLINKKNFQPKAF